MKIKKFRAATVEQAVALARNELGHDVTILHTRDVRTGGWLGIFQQKQVQLTVGVSEDPHHGKKGDQLSQMHSPIQQQVQVFLKNQGVKPSIQTNLLLTSTMIERSGVTDFKTIVKRMFTSTMKVRVKKPCQKKLFFIAGATGVGKTTTLAKLAAKAIYQDQKKIAFITLDTFRIAAVDQLRKYAEILECDVHVAYDTAQLVRFCETVEADLILIDTAGRNYLTESMPSELLYYITNHVEAEFHLAVSLTSKLEDSLELLKRFSTTEITGLVLTKKDETTSIGSLIELLYVTDVPISCVTTGQQVPDDLWFPEKQDIINWMRLEEEQPNGPSAS
ncbi:flagellar biosynthesis protein FlhF [Bacillus sp. JCM 19045]|nr:flagellar biosynthesis protein FlhF [Bacillus sp. JCM 19045]